MPENPLDMLFGKGPEASKPVTWEGKYSPEMQETMQGLWGNLSPQLGGAASWNYEAPDVGGFTDVPEYQPYGFEKYGMPGGFGKYGAFKFETPELEKVSPESPEYQGLFDVASKNIGRQVQKGLGEKQRSLEYKGLGGGPLAELMTGESERAGQEALSDYAAGLSKDVMEKNLTIDQANQQAKMWQQTQQAAENYKSQGYTDEQAKWLADQDWQKQVAEATEKGSAWDKMLSGKGLGLEGTLESSKLGLMGEQTKTGQQQQLLNLLQQYFQSILPKNLGQTGGTAGAPGLFQTAIGAAGQAGGFGNLF